MQQNLGGGMEIQMRKKKSNLLLFKSHVSIAVWKWSYMLMWVSGFNCFWLELPSQPSDLSPIINSSWVFLNVFS